MGSAVDRFSISYFFSSLNMGLKHSILPKDHFKTHLFFFNFWVGGPFSAWILVGRVCQTFRALYKGHLKSVKDPYHTELIS